MTPQSADWSVAAIAIAVFAAVLAALVFVRRRAGQPAEVKLTDALIAAVPVFIGLFATGHIRELSLGSEGLKVAAAELAITTAAAGSVTPQVADLPTSEIEVAAKGTPDQIPGMIERQTQALMFRLRHGGYDGGVIAQFLEELTPFPFFRYVIVETETGAFFGMIDARKLLSILRRGFLEPRAFAEMLNDGGDGARAFLAGIPGFIAADWAVKAGVPKLDVLRAMEERDADWLPVVGADGALKGLVDRSRLTASLILEVATQLSERTVAP